MTLKQLIANHNWSSIALVLKELYPDQESNLDGYDEVYNKLMIMNPESTELSISVTNEVDDFDGEAYVHVSGIYETPRTEEEKWSHAIEFVPWKEWLGMEITQDSLNNFSEMEIIAHALFEMTFVGFDEKNIQSKLNSIEDSVEDFKNLTDEEKKAQSYSIDECLKFFKNQNNEDRD